MDRIWYELKNINDLIQLDIKIDNLHIIEIDSHNLNDYSNLVKLEIEKFNSEIQWHSMWTFEECQTRLFKNHKLFIFLKNNLPLGHVWYDTNYLYNAYVSKERINGESVWFISETIKTIFKENISTIILHTEDWNIRAKKFWEKIGFTILKND